MWILQRTEDEFPDLANATRWEFVARRNDDSDKWTDVEEKCLVVADAERRFNDWAKLVAEVDRSLAMGLSGNFFLLNLPHYKFDQKQARELISCRIQVLQEIDSSLDAGDLVDIGPQIKDLFNDWPVDLRSQPRITKASLRPEYPPHKLLIMKHGDSGGSVKVGGQVARFWAQPEIGRAIGQILEKGKANRQLMTATSRGAAKTVLLLHNHIDCDPGAIADAICEGRIERNESIDEFWLVSDFGGEHVEMVWKRADVI